EQLRDLEGSGQPEVADPGAAQARDAAPLVADRSPVGGQHPCNHIEESRFSGAIGTDERHDLALCDLHRDVVHGDQATEAALYVLYLKHVVDLSIRDAVCAAAP